MTDEQALLCPARVRGFSLTEKVWGLFLVEEVRDIKWAEDVYRKLALDPVLKDIIQALVSNYGTGISSMGHFDDIIAGKGRGLIFLLSGPPGLGKTLTVGKGLSPLAII